MSSAARGKSKREHNSRAAPSASTRPAHSDGKDARRQNLSSLRSRGQYRGRGTARSALGTGEHRINGTAHSMFRKHERASTKHDGGSYQERYEALEASRKRERADAIRRGLVADPDKPRRLSDAITLVGTCQDMCAEFERVQRVVQKDVWKEETDPASADVNPLEREPDEARMVKKFRRAAAGIEEQLPSDLRPPHILKQTCDYLFHDVIDNAKSLAKVHHFVWDRTRAIRNDFSIQQITKPQELSIAIECYERIARFHIVSLHHLALPQKPYDKYDWQQEREQLDRTLLSLMQYYDAGRDRVPLPNEAEFKAYSVIFQMQDPMPDLEDRVQSWRRGIALDPRVQKALQIYAAGCTTSDRQGPLKPAATHATAQQDWYGFWRQVESKNTSYLMACVAEIYFNLVRKTVLQGLLKSSSQKQMMQYNMEEMRHMLAFDYDEEVEEFCERYGLAFKEVNGEPMLDMSVLHNKRLPEAKATATKQTKSELVEQKRCGRTFPAIINGLTVRQAREQGLIVENVELEMVDADEQPAQDGDQYEDSDDGLFVTDTRKQAEQTPSNLFSFGKPSTTTGTAFGQAVLPSTSASLNGKPVSTTNTMFGQPSASLVASGSPFTKGLGAANTPSPFTLHSAAKDTTSSNAEASFGRPSFGNTNGSAQVAQSAQLSGTVNIANASTPSARGLTFGKPAVPDGKDVVAQPAQLVLDGENIRQPSLFDNVKTDLAATESPFAKTTERKSLFDRTTTSADDTRALASTETHNASSLFAPSSSWQPSPFAATRPASASSSSAAQKASATKDSADPASITPANQQVDNTTTTSFFAPSLTARADPTPSFQPQSTADKLSNSFTTTTPQTTLTKKAPSLGLFAKPQAAAGTADPLSSNTSAPSHIGPASVARPPSAQVPQVLDNSRQPSILGAANKTHPAKATEPDLSTVLSKIASELTLDPATGLLGQYVDFLLSQIVTEAQEKVYHERIEREAQDYRIYTISLRYGLFWRDICRRRRLARHGRDQRARANKRLNELKSQQSDTSSMGASVSSQSRRIYNAKDKTKMVDEAFQRTAQAGRWSRQPSSGSNSRSASQGSMQHSTNNDKPAEGTCIDKTVSRVDHGGRVVKPVARTSQTDLRRSVHALVGSRNTTRSTYFKRKAMGIPDAVAPVQASSRKRAYTEMSNGSMQRLSESMHSSPSTTSVKDNYSPEYLSGTSSAVTKLQKTSIDEDALLARARAIRENLAAGTSFVRDEVANFQDAQRFDRGVTAYNSPTLEKARVEARHRMALLASMSPQDAPAYRKRLSKFVPRAKYTDAIDRARTILEERSNTNSRPGSRLSEAAGDAVRPNGISNQHSSSPNDHAVQPAVDNNTAAAIMPSTSQPSIENFSNSTHTLSHQPMNNALSINGNSYDNTQTTFGTDELVPPQSQARFHPSLGHDFTIPPSQIPETLSASFGHGSAEKQESSYADYNQHSTHTPDGIDLSHYASSASDSNPEAAYVSSNPFAALADNADVVEDLDELASEPEVIESDVEDDTDDYGHYDAGVQEDEDVDGSDEVDEQTGYGDVEDELEEDEMETDEEDYDDDEGEVPATHQYGAYNKLPQPNQALQAVGNTEDDAIELSD